MDEHGVQSATEQQIVEGTRQPCSFAVYTIRLTVWRGENKPSKGAAHRTWMAKCKDGVCPVNGTEDSSSGSEADIEVERNLLRCLR